MPDVSVLSLLLLVHFVLALWACGHILMTKTESAAPGWIALVLVSPFIGSLFYWILGINRVERRAHKLRGRRTGGAFPEHAAGCGTAVFKGHSGHARSREAPQ